jgi:hypothetical protein
VSRATYCETGLVRFLIFTFKTELIAHRVWRTLEL